MIQQCGQGKTIERDRVWVSERAYLIYILKWYNHLSNVIFSEKKKKKKQIVTMNNVFA